MNEERTLQEAARRFARLQAHDCAQAEREAERAWREEDPAHQAASDLAERVAASIDRMAASEQLSARLKALADEAFAAYPPAAAGERSDHAKTSRRWRIGVGLAAALAFAAVAWQLSSQSLLRDSRQVTYATAEHERRRVTLEEGSVVELDVGTQISVRMSPERRQVELLSGRALFEVAHDSSRPFSVQAAESRTTALGTQFQVQRQTGRVVVTLAQGSVAVDGTSGAWRERLVPGEQLRIDASTAQRAREFVDTQLVTSWAHGRHVFRGTPLHEALDEVNRYASRKVRLGDPSLADLPVAGNFVAGDSEVVVNAFAAVLPLRVVEGSDHEIILFRRYTDQ